MRKLVVKREPGLSDDELLRVMGVAPESPVVRGVKEILARLGEAFREAAIDSRAPDRARLDATAGMAACDEALAQVETWRERGCRANK